MQGQAYLIMQVEGKSQELLKIPAQKKLFCWPSSFGTVFSPRLFFFSRAVDCISGRQQLYFKDSAVSSGMMVGTQGNQLQLGLPVVPRCCEGSLAVQFATREG